MQAKERALLPLVLGESIGLVEREDEVLDVRRRLPMQPKPRKQTKAMTAMNNRPTSGMSHQKLPAAVLQVPHHGM